MTNANKTRILVSWSSGKDSAWALHLLRQQNQYEIVGLLTTVDQAAEQVPMHVVAEPLLDAQAAATGLPLSKVYLPNPCPNDVYETLMAETLARAQSQGITAIAFGDLFLEDVRRYREQKLAGIGMKAIFPLWQMDTAALAREMVAAGVRAHITSVDTKQLDAGFIGRTFDRKFIEDLPAEVDPCGERGEFHSFVYQGPMLQHRIPFTPQQIMPYEGFVYQKLS